MAGDSAFAQTLPGKQVDLDFGLIEPTGMLGSVMEGESLPKSLSLLDAEMTVERFAAMGVEVVQNQVVFRQNNVRVETDLIHGFAGRFATDVRADRGENKRIG